MEESSWRFQQVFGDKGAVEAGKEDAVDAADVISAVEFDDTGDYLAIGDKGGRVVILERAAKRRAGTSAGGKGEFTDFRVMTEFQSHEPEFDFLKSLEIEEKINQIRWCKRQCSSHFLLTTNDKTIKLWKVHEKKVKNYTNTNFDKSTKPALPPSPLVQLRVPRVQVAESAVAHVPKRVYANAHAYHINSISINTDGETFISADDLRVNMWSLQHSDQSFNIVDIKPANMEDLTEVITSASFHPLHCNTFMYSSSKGTIKLADMRSSALCDRHSKVFEQEEEPGSRTFFSEIISSISDAKFSRDGRYILSRDYLTLKIWDLNMERAPVKTISIHDQLRPKLCDLYENDCIFDKFECCFSGDGNHVMTGSYKNLFHVFDRNGKNDICLEASRHARTRKPSTKSKLLGRSKPTKKAEDFETADFGKKCLHMAWHPHENTIAVAATNNLFLYSA